VGPLRQSHIRHKLLSDPRSARYNWLESSKANSESIQLAAKEIDVTNDRDRESEISQSIGQRLQDYMEERQLTHTQLGKKLGVSRNTVSRLVTGQASVSARLLAQIANVLNIEMSELVRDAPPQRRHQRVPDGSPLAGPLSVYIDSSAYSADEKGELLSLISELYSLQSGDRLVIDNKGMAEPAVTSVVVPDDGGSR
jgi:transcriptional regulator with XRE-family HTH domain